VAHKHTICRFTISSTGQMVGQSRFRLVDANGQDIRSKYSAFNCKPVITSNPGSTNKGDVQFGSKADFQFASNSDLPFISKPMDHKVSKPIHPFVSSIIHSTRVEWVGRGAGL
ncbi:MAG: hypothetical protein ACI8VW_004084, partial [bacterium]